MSNDKWPPTRHHSQTGAIVTTPPTVAGAVEGNAATDTKSTFVVPAGLDPGNPVGSGDVMYATAQLFSPGDTATLVPVAPWVQIASNHQVPTGSASDANLVATFMKPYKGVTGTETVCNWTGPAFVTTTMAALRNVKTGSTPTIQAFATPNASPTTTFTVAGLNTPVPNTGILAFVWNDFGYGYNPPASYTSLLGVILGLGLFFIQRAASGQMNPKDFVTLGSNPNDQVVIMLAAQPKGS